MHVELQFFVLLHHFIAHENAVAAAELFDFFFFSGHAEDVLLFQKGHGFVHLEQFLDLLVGGEGTGGGWWLVVDEVVVPKETRLVIYNNNQQTHNQTTKQPNNQTKQNNQNK